jgi:hypothetical protein
MLDRDDMPTNEVSVLLGQLERTIKRHMSDVADG